MKIETVVIITKGACDAFAAGSLTAVACMAQWASGDQAIPKVALYVIWLSAAGAAAKALGSFLSTSFGKYLALLSADTPAAPVDPQKP
jgi:hypothetical protein